MSDENRDSNTGQFIPSTENTSGEDHANLKAVHTWPLWRNLKRTKILPLQSGFPTGARCMAPLSGLERQALIDAAHLCDETGKPTGQKLTLKPKDNPREVAGMLFLSKWNSAAANAKFNQPMHYRTPQAIV